MRYAGFWIRSLAELIDTVILSIVAWIGEVIVFGIAYGVLWAMRGGAQLPPLLRFEEAFNPLHVQIVNAAIYAVLSVPYYVIGHYKYGTTLGKSYGITWTTFGKCPGIYVVQARSGEPITLRQSWVRCFSYVLSYLPMGCGFLMAAFQPEKRALHDLIAGTVSIRRFKKRSAPVVAAAFIGLTLLTGTLAGSVCRAEEHAEEEAWPSTQFQSTLSGVFGEYSSKGAELEVAALAAPFDAHDLRLGVRLGYYSAATRLGHREEVITGFEGIVWMVNAIGLGAAFDVAVPTVQPAFQPTASWPVETRWELFLGVRLLRVENSGALGLRAGYLHHSEYGSNARVGITWEWSGVP